MEFDDDLSEYSISNTTPLPAINTNILTISEVTESETEPEFIDADEFVFDPHVDHTYKTDVEIQSNDTLSETTSDPNVPAQTNTDLNQSTIKPIYTPSEEDFKSNKLSNLDKVQLNNLQSMNFDYSTFVSRRPFKNFLSDYVMPAKAFNSDDKLYNVFSDDASGVLELKYLYDNPFTPSNIVHEHKFLYHYSNVPLETNTISLSHLHTMSNIDIVANDIFLEFNLSTSLDKLNPIPVRILALNIVDGDGTNATFEMVEPIPTFDLHKGLSLIHI